MQFHIQDDTKVIQDCIMLKGKLDSFIITQFHIHRINIFFKHFFTNLGFHIQSASK